VANAVQANLRAALTREPDAIGRVYNVAVGQRTTLKQLHDAIASALRVERPSLQIAAPHFAPFRAGDVRHSLADVSLARDKLGYVPTHSMREGLAEAVAWYVERSKDASRQPTALDS
jgi:UDP-N-acetylglucosamine 4-epimerase